MAIFCGRCGKARGLPVGSLRTASEPCQYCNGYESFTNRRHVGRPPNRRVVVTEDQLLNFEYPDNLIPNMPGNVETAAHKEYEGVEVSGTPSKYDTRGW